jgi:hypothetical protein
MKIAFDIHGTLDDDKDGMLMRILDNELKKGSDVFIISGPPKKQIMKEVEKLGVDVNKVTIISVVDWLKDKGVEMWLDKKNTWWCSDKEWWTSKGKICEEYKIDMMFDDCHGYHVAMPKTTEFVHWTGYSKRDR